MSIIMLIVSLLPVAADAIPGLSAAVKQVIKEVTAALAAIAGSGVLQQQNVSTVLLALQGVIAALKSEPSIPPAILQLIDALDRAAQAALEADKLAQQGVVPSNLQPITPLP